MGNKTHEFASNKVNLYGRAFGQVVKNGIPIRKPWIVFQKLADQLEQYQCPATNKCTNRARGRKLHTPRATRTRWPSHSCGPPRGGHSRARDVRTDGEIQGR